MATFGYVMWLCGAQAALFDAQRPGHKYAHSDASKAQVCVRSSFCLSVCFLLFRGIPLNIISFTATSLLTERECVSSSLIP